MAYPDATKFSPDPDSAPFQAFREQNRLVFCTTMLSLPGLGQTEASEPECQGDSVASRKSGDRSVGRFGVYAADRAGEISGTAGTGIFFRGAFGCSISARTETIVSPDSVPDHSGIRHTCTEQSCFVLCPRAVEMRSAQMKVPERPAEKHSALFSLAGNHCFSNSVPDQPGIRHTFRAILLCAVSTGSSAELGRPSENRSDRKRRMRFFVFSLAENHPFCPIPCRTTPGFGTPVQSDVALRCAHGQFS